MLEGNDNIKLYDLSINEQAIIKELQFEESRIERFSAMGFVVGSEIELIKKGNTCICNIKGIEIGISKTEANKVIVERISYKNNKKSENRINAQYHGEYKSTTKEKIVKSNKDKNSRQEKKTDAITISKKRILLIGNPNVGKSQIFSRITSLKVISSNFPGTTVEIKEAEASFYGTVNDKNYRIQTTVVDIPGLYNINLDNSYNDVEKNNVEIIAAKSILDVKSYDLILCVLDTEFLERSLNLALLLQTLNKPIIYVLNKYKTAKSKGIHVNKKILREELNRPVVSIEAISGFGLHKLEEEIVKVFSDSSEKVETDNEIKVNNNNWERATEICRKVLFLEHRHPTFLEKLSAACVHPVGGIFIAILVLGIAIFTIFYSGELIIGFLNGLFDTYLLPHIEDIGNISGLPDYVKEFFIGKNSAIVDIDGEIIRENPGLFYEGLTISFIDVFTYFSLFYLVFEILADIGYLPRLAILMDSLLHHIGIHGYGIIPLLMGFGCKVPAIFSTRVLESKRERFIALILILMIFPCISGTSMILSLAANKNIPIYAPITVFAIIILIGILSGFFLNKIKKGDSSEIFLEIPPLQIPRLKEIGLKMGLRMKEFFLDTAPLILLGIAIINILTQLNVFHYISNNSVVEFIISDLMGLPKETAFNVLFGFLRKDVSIGLLAGVNGITVFNYIVACVFMSIYLPCTGTIFVMKREFGLKNTILAMAITLVISFSIAVILNFFFKLF